MQRQLESLWRNRGFEREGCNLGKRMNARIGATGALGKDALANCAKYDIRKNSLNGWEVRLDLPAMIESAVIRNRELKVRHKSAVLDGNTRRRSDSVRASGCGLIYLGILRMAHRGIIGNCIVFGLVPRVATAVARRRFKVLSLPSAFLNRSTLGTRLKMNH